MRIGLYAPGMTSGAPSGVERYVAEFVKALAGLDSGHEFILFSDGAAPPPIRWVPLPQMGWFRRLRSDRGGFSRLARRERLDLVHCTKSSVPPGLDCPAVVTVFDVIFRRHPEFYPAWWRWYWNRQLRKSVRRAAEVICISERTARDLEEFFPECRGRLQAIPLGVGPEFDAISEEAAAEERRLLGVEGPYILGVGNLTVRKNIPRLLEAMEEIRRRHPVRLVWVGALDYGGREILELLERAERSGAARYVGSVGRASLAALYRGAMALVYPSRYEGFGLPVLEAMSCGCPVVAAAAGALPEVVGEAGLLVEPDSASGLAAAICRLLEDGNLRAELARKGRERAGEFSWRRTAEETLAVYRRVLGMPGS